MNISIVIHLYGFLIFWSGYFRIFMVPLAQMPE